MRAECPPPRAARLIVARKTADRVRAILDAGELQLLNDGVPRIGAIMEVPKDAPFHARLFYFGVNSIAAAKEAIEASRGKILNGPHEVPGGQWIIIATDPQGVAFGVVGPQGA
jgi:uncharacterized protein